MQIYKWMVKASVRPTLWTPSGGSSQVWNKHRGRGGTHTHATAVQPQKSESCLTLVKVRGVRCPVSLLFLLSASMHTTGSLSHSFYALPTTAPALPSSSSSFFFFAPCPPQSQPLLSRSATWVMPTPGTPLASVPFLSLDQLLTPASSPHVFCSLPTY